MDLEQGLFRDDPQFDELVDDVSQDLLEIGTANNRAWEQLRRSRAAAKHGRGAASRESLLELVQANQTRFRQVKPELERLQQWSEATPAQRYSQHKLAADFRDVFAEFQRVQQQVVTQTRRELDARAAARPGRRDSRGIEMDEAPAYAAGSATAAAESTAAESSAAESSAAAETTAASGLLAAEPAEAQAASQAFEEQLRQDEISYQAGLVAEREEEIENVSRGMNELNEIFQNLSTIVTEQGTVLDNIESNIHNVAASTAAGSQQLTKAARWQRSSTGRSLCFLIILLILAVVVIASASIH